jgi:hypothetical protein
MIIINDIMIITVYLLSLFRVRLFNRIFFNNSLIIIVIVFKCA